MHISVSDLEFLIHLENRLGCFENWSEDVTRLWKLNEKLIKQRDKTNKRTREYVAEQRKTNEFYGRSKQEIERIKNKKNKQKNYHKEVNKNVKK